MVSASTIQSGTLSWWPHAHLQSVFFFCNKTASGSAELLFQLRLFVAFDRAHMTFKEPSLDWDTHHGQISISAVLSWVLLASLVWWTGTAYTGRNQIITDSICKAPHRDLNNLQFHILMHNSSQKMACMIQGMLLTWPCQRSVTRLRLQWWSRHVRGV